MQIGRQEATEKVLVQRAGKLKEKDINMTVIMKVDVIRFGEFLTICPIRQIYWLLGILEPCTVSMM